MSLNVIIVECGPIRQWFMTMDTNDLQIGLLHCNAQYMYLIFFHE